MILAKVSHNPAAFHSGIADGRCAPIRSVPNIAPDTTRCHTLLTLLHLEVGVDYVVALGGLVG